MAHSQIQSQNFVLKWKSRKICSSFMMNLITWVNMSENWKFQTLIENLQYQILRKLSNGLGADTMSQ